MEANIERAGNKEEGQHFKAWFPYDRSDRPNRLKKNFRRSGRSYGNATQTIANDPDD